MAGKGFAAVVARAAEDKERRAAFGQGYLPFFSMQDGETVDGLWFIGTDDEPLVIDVHTMQTVDKATGRKAWRTVVHSDSECVPCYLAREGDRRISRIQNKAVFNVADPHWIHKVKDKEASKDGKDKFKYLVCTNDDDGDGDCKYCAKGLERERSGKKRWELAMQWASALAAINEQLKAKCECGGKIRKGECSKCNDTRPLSIFKVPFTVTRTGADKNTTYQFTAGAIEDMPDWVAELEPSNLEELYKPKSPAAQAEMMGVANPYSRVAASVRQASNDDDGESDIFG